MTSGMEKEIFEVYLEDIIPNRFQPRLSFDDNELSELATSIKEHGIIQPLVLRKVGDKYEIIAGERRYKASSMAGLQKVPAIIMNIDDQESAQIAVVENIQRKNLTPLEEARSYKKLLDKNYLTQEQLAVRMGKAQATISNKLRLLNLDPEVQEALLNEKISERHARSLLSLKNPEEQKEFLNRIIASKLTVRQTDELIKAKLEGSVPPSGTNNNATGNDDGDILDLTSINNSPPVINIPNNTVEEKKEEVIPQEPIGETMNNEDINRIKEEAVDINQNREAPNIDRLLSLNGGGNIVEPKKEEPLPTIPTNTENKFITSLEDETTDMNMGDIALEATPTVTPINEEPTIPKNDVDIQKPVNVPPVMPEVKVQERRDYLPPEQTDEGATVNRGELKSAINAVRELTKTLERNGFVVDEEEFDFEHLYQIIIKINK